MYIERIKIKNFRNHNYLTYTFNKGVNIIFGDNGVGKTNIIEALYYLSFAKSFRGVMDNELIQNGKISSSIEADINVNNIKQQILITFQKDSRHIFLNNKPISRLSELTNIINIILFEPKDVMLFRGSPKDRRLFLDVNLSKKSQPYLEYISRYEKLLKERNEILKQEKIDEVLLKTTTEMLVKLTAPIISYRALYFKDINDILNNITCALTGEEMNLELVYKPFVPIDNQIINNVTEAYEKALETDLKKKMTTIGVHREDFLMMLNGKDISIYGSQGENRLAALMLKLTPYFLITDQDKKPIILLDDVMSELDDDHQKQFLKAIKKFNQVFITATKLSLNGASHYEIKEKHKEVF